MIGAGDYVALMGLPGARPRAFVPRILSLLVVVMAIVSALAAGVRCPAGMTCGALASLTSSVRLGTLVTGNTYRNPAVLAKCVTTLDLVSGGRAQLGIGSGWFELEHDSFGIEFGTFTMLIDDWEISVRKKKP